MRLTHHRPHSAEIVLVRAIICEKLTFHQFDPVSSLVQSHLSLHVILLCSEQIMYSSGDRGGVGTTY